MNVSISDDDWVGAFNGDVCVGAHQWNISLCGGGVCSIPVLGYSGLPVNDGYCCDNCDREVVTPSRLAIGDIVRKHWRNLTSGN